MPSGQVARQGQVHYAIKYSPSPQAVFLRI